MAAGLFGIALGFLWLPLLAVGVPVFGYGVYRWTREYAVDEFERGVIPAQKRQLLGLPSGTLTMWLVILSEIFVFGALFASLLYLEAVNGPWPPDGLALDLPYAIGLTVLLVSSGILLHWGKDSLENGDRRRFGYGVAGAFVLGSAFLVGQLYEYSQFMAKGLTPTEGPYGSTFYALTGMHGAHVAAGLVLIGVIGLRAWRRGHFSENRHLMVRATTLYWHFVDAVWLVILVVVYFRFSG
ncbi:cytochrome c oxidase subunit III [Halalkaliarchaeum desulfuricum]|uniref:Cytochrome c oxidase subunit III n=1 Tax=Halalkaliarchaeum desulfuricum TaxID=2055893 RepID=A0A343TJF3_9EURY|nr:cytochrome c oxidase subunit III [Halalkaliarchaeum desulfuricum]